MKKVLLAFLLFDSYTLSAKYNYNESIKNTNFPVYTVDEVKLPNFKKGAKPDNIILLIGDGMGVAQIQAGMTVNNGQLYISLFRIAGFSKTHSENNYITDSAAGGTALSTGKKTHNGYIAMSPEGETLKTILEYAEDKGKSTGLVSTSSITHATPASFIAHQKSRNLYENIAADFLKTDIDVFIGGGYDNFANRKDNQNLISDLKEKGYYVDSVLNSDMASEASSIALLLAPEHLPPFDERGNMLPLASNLAIKKLNENKKGFFLMIEGSQIDWGGHANNTEYIVGEMLDFDYTVGEALKFAAKDKKTLIIVTADHETGGMTVNAGDYKSGEVDAKYTTKKHSGVMVPIFAYGPGAENFGGIMDNTEVFSKMKALLIGN